MKTAETQDLYFKGQFLFLIKIWSKITAQNIRSANLDSWRVLLGRRGHLRMHQWNALSQAATECFLYQNGEKPTSANIVFLVFLSENIQDLILMFNCRELKGATAEKGTQRAISNQSNY